MPADDCTCPPVRLNNARGDVIGRNLSPNCSVHREQEHQAYRQLFGRLLEDDPITQAADVLRALASAVDDPLSGLPDSLLRWSSDDLMRWARAIEYED